MSLSADLISQFTKVTKPEENTKKETTVYGSIVKYGDDFYARIDGSDTLTPISSTVDVKDGDRVSMLIKNHSAVVTGNFSKPAVNEDSQVFKGMVTFAGLSGGTTTIDGACIKTGKIKAERLELTGAITWGDLSDDTKDEIAANGGISSSEARSIANSAIANLAAGKYVGSTTTFIDKTTIRAPSIEGGVIIGSEFYGSTFNIINDSENTGAFTMTGHYFDRVFDVFAIEYEPDLSPLVVLHSPCGGTIQLGAFDPIKIDGMCTFTTGTEINFNSNNIHFDTCDIDFATPANGGAASSINFTGVTVTGLSVVFG